MWEQRVSLAHRAQFVLSPPPLPSPLPLAQLFSFVSLETLVLLLRRSAQKKWIRTRCTIRLFLNSRNIIYVSFEIRC
jgi:hypothetical protein